MKKMSAWFLLLLFVASCSNPAAPVEKKTETGLSPAAFQQAMAELYLSNARWNQLGQSDKVKAVETVMSMFKDRENVAMMKSADFYVRRTDEMLKANPSFGLNLPTILKILAVMEYDYYNGQNKDELARQVLGEMLYEQNKRRREAEGLK